MSLGFTQVGWLANHWKGDWKDEMSYDVTEKLINYHKLPSITVIK